MNGAVEGPREAAEALGGGDRVVGPATCLGCGCACDDIEVVVAGGRIAEARRACPLGAAWFGDGVVPARARVDGREATVEEALHAMARLLSACDHPIIYLAPELSCEAQRAGVALADALGATLDSVTSDTVLSSVLAAQERGRAGATLGEVRNRGDVIVFWGVDPARRYPRYTTRYAPEPVGVHLPAGRRSRTVVAVDVVPADDAAAADSRGPGDADVRVSLHANDEVAVLIALRALVTTPEGDGRRLLGRDGDVWNLARQLAPTLLGARYAVVVNDAEPVAGRDPERGDALVALAQALNGRTRCALSTLRGGGNRVGAESVMTSQAGFPAAIDFARGVPRFRPYDGSAMARLTRAEEGGDGGNAVTTAVLVLGDASQLPAELRAALTGASCVLLGPRASECALAAAVTVIDTGVAGIHEGGTALRMDDVPLPLRPSVAGPPDTAALVRQLHERVARFAAPAMEPVP